MRPLDEQTVLITGATGGLGRALVHRAAGHGATVVAHGRDERRLRDLALEVEEATGTSIDTVAADLADLREVDRLADSVLDTYDRLDVLVNNAGVAGTNALSRDGFDLTYATNHIGPFLFTTLIRPVLLQAPQGRIVNVSSAAHLHAPTIDWSLLQRRSAPRRSGFQDYSVTKLMNVLHAKELARRLAGTRVTTYALHPGAVRSNIWRALPLPLQWVLKLFMLSNAAGAKTPLYCATAPELAAVSGRYYDNSREAPSNPLADDTSLAEELWTRTEAAIASAGDP